jgi:hypothetical protein
MPPVRAADAAPGTKAALGEVQAITNLTPDTVVFDPAQIRQIHAALEHEVFHQAPHRIVGERGDHRGAQPEAAAHTARDVVLAAPFPGLKPTRGVDATLPRIQAQHHLAETDQVEFAIAGSFEAEIAHRPIHPPSTVKTCP